MTTQFYYVYILQTQSAPSHFYIVGALTLYFGMRGVHRARESTMWPVADGAIQNATVEYQSSNKGGGTYHAQVFYQFTAEGQTHSGNKVVFGDYGSSNPSHAQNIVNRYPKGMAVKVHYRTGDPDTCVLEPGLHGQAWFLPGFGLIFFVTGSVMAVFLPRLMTRPEMQAEPPGTPGS